MHIAQWVSALLQADAVSAGDELPNRGSQQQQSGEAPQHSVAGFSVEAPASEAAVMRKVDRHILPFFFSLALLCTLDRGTSCQC